MRRRRYDEGWTLDMFQIDNPDNTLEASEVTVNSCHPMLSLSMKNEGSRLPYIDGSGTDKSLSKSLFITNSKDPISFTLRVGLKRREVLMHTGSSTAVVAVLPTTIGTSARLLESSKFRADYAPAGSVPWETCRVGALDPATGRLGRYWDWL